jgi:hypothetical protein
VVGFRETRALLMPFGPVEGVAPGAEIRIQPDGGLVRPTKAWLVGVRNDPKWKAHFDWVYGKRPREELYAYRSDRWQLTNIADDPAHPFVVRCEAFEFERQHLSAPEVGAEVLPHHRRLVEVRPREVQPAQALRLVGRTEVHVRPVDRRPGA